MRRPVSSMPIASAMRDLALQQRHAAVERQAADARLGQAERRVLGGHDDVAAEHHLEAAADRMAVDARDHRHVERLAQRDAAEAAGPRRRPVFEPARAAAALHVGAGAEGALAGAGEHDARGPRGRCSISSQIVCSSRSVAASIGVEHLRPVDGDAGDVVRDRRSTDRHHSAARRARAAAELGQHLLGVLAERGGGERGSSPARPTCGSASRPRARARPRRGASRIMPLIGGLLVGQRLGERAHRRAEQVLLLEPRHPMRRGVGREALPEDRLQRRLVLDLRRRRSRSADRPARSVDAERRRRCRCSGSALKAPTMTSAPSRGLEHAGERHRAPVQLAPAHQLRRRLPASAPRASNRAATPRPAGRGRSSPAAAARAACPAPDACRRSSRRRSSA